MIHPWKEIDRIPLLSEPFTRVDRVRYQLPDGRHTERDIRLSPDVAVIVARTTEHTFIVNQEFRPGPNKVLYDLPGGMLDANEDPLQAAQRELLEETGYTGTFHHLASYYFSAYSTGQKHIFLADQCVKTACQSLDETELIEIDLLDLAAFKKALLQTPTNDTDAALLALHHLHLL